MSTNCVSCVKNKRTGNDLLCDECRLEDAQRVSEKRKEMLLRIARERNQELARVAELEGLLQRWLSLHEEPCRLDHHANCQSHFLEPYCIVARTRNALAAKTEPLTGETNAV